MSSQHFCKLGVLAGSGGRGYPANLAWQVARHSSEPSLAIKEGVSYLNAFLSL